MTPDEKIRQITTLLWFLYGSCENKDMYMSYQAREAFDAACALLGLESGATFAMIDKQWKENLE